MDSLVEKLDARLRQRTPETAAQVSQQLREVIELAGRDVLDLMRSRDLHPVLPALCPPLLSPCLA